MTTLQLQQSALLDALFASPQHPTTPHGAPAGQLPFTGARGLQAYRANASALAQRTLRAAFPVLEQLIGQAGFHRMAVHFWHCHPPQHGDLAQWGGALPDFLRENPQLADDPYLADVARVEWAMHLATTHTDDAADVASFSLLSGPHAAQQTLRLASGCCVLASRYPVGSIVTAHLYGNPSLSQAGDLLRRAVAEHALVWRQGMRPQVRSCGSPEALLLGALASGLALGDALAAAAGLDFGAWLPQAVQEGLVLGARPVVMPA